MSKIYRQSGGRQWENIHVWMLLHDCLHDHMDDVAVLEKLGRQVMLFSCGWNFLYSAICSCRLILHLAKASDRIAVLSTQWQVSALS